MKYRGIEIEQDEDGYFWRNGPSCRDGGGCFETLQEAEEDIDDCVVAPNPDFPELMDRNDSPSLPDPWWHAR